MIVNIEMVHVDIKQARADSSLGQSWETLKSKAKTLKGELDTKMQELGQLSRQLGKATGTTSPGGRVAALDSQIQAVVNLREQVERGLGELGDANEALTRVASTSQQAHLANSFRETQQELVRDFKRISQSIEHQYQHARLLPKGRSATAASLDEAEEGLMRERHSLSSSLSMADDIISQASTTRDMLSGQRRSLGEINSKVGTLESILPGINGIIGKISDRQTKERLVLTFTVAGCCFFTIWYKFM